MDDNTISMSEIHNNDMDRESSLEIHFNKGQYAQNPSTITLGGIPLPQNEVQVFHGGQDGNLPLISNEMLTQTLINHHQFVKMKIM